MFINIIGKKDQNGLFKFEIPVLSLDRRFNYKVGLHHLNFKMLESSQNYIDNDLLCLTTSLIDLSNRNPLQSLIAFGNDSRSIIRNYIPSIVQYHPIQLYDLENCSFSIRHYLSDREISLEYLYLNLEILRTDAYGRI